MNDRPVLDRNLDSKIFRDYYYLKEELVNFCRENGIPVSGGKIEIADRIAYFLETGKILSVSSERKKGMAISVLSEDAKIEANFVCSEKHRIFFREHIGNSFSFNVAFQKWLKNNTGKTYKEAIAAYYQILEDILAGLLVTVTRGEARLKDSTFLVLSFCVFPHPCALGLSLV